MISPVIITDSIGKIPRDQWDALNGDNPLSTYGWLLAVEETLIRDISPVYFVFQESGKIAGATVCYTVSRKANILSFDDLLFGRLKSVANSLGFSFLPGMVCCPFKSSGQHILLAGDPDGEQEKKIVERLLDAMEAEASQRNMTLGFCQVWKQEDMLINRLLQRGFYQTLDLPLTYLNISWDNFEGYKSYIRKKSLKWKRNIAQDMNKNCRSGVKIELVEDISGEEDLMVELLNNNYMKHNHVNLPYNNNILNRLKTNLKEDVGIYRAVKNGRTIGLSVLVKKNTEWNFVLVGVDHELAQKDATYFNILFYRPIQDAISSQIKRIYYGSGLYDLKIRRGCDMMRTHVFYKSPHPMLNFVVKIWFIFHRFWYQRKFG